MLAWEPLWVLIRTSIGNLTRQWAVLFDTGAPQNWADAKRVNVTCSFW